LCYAVLTKNSEENDLLLITKNQKCMKTDQSPVAFYKDLRFWLVMIFTTVLVVYLLATYPA